MLRFVLFLLGLYFVEPLAGQVQLAGIPFALAWDNEPLRFSVDNGSLSMTAGPKTDLFRDPSVTYNTDNAPKLLFQPDDDFVISAAIRHDFRNKWDGGALVLKADSLHWVKFCYEKDYTGARRVVSVVTKGISDDCNAVSFKNKRIYFKMAKASPVLTLYISKNQRRWLLVRHLHFPATSGLRVGFLAQSPTGSENTVVFSDIRYEKKRISDPYTGM